MMKNRRKKQLYIIVSILMMFLFAIGLTFAYFSYRKRGSEISLSSGNTLNITFKSQNNYFKESELSRVSDTFGKESPNKVEIELTGTKPSLYNDIGFNIEILPIKQGETYTNSEGIGNISETNVNLEQVKTYLSINTEQSKVGLTDVKRLTDLEINPETGGYILFKNQFSVVGVTSKNYAVRVWLDDSYEEQAQLDFKVVIYAYNKEAKSYKTLEKLGLVNYLETTYGLGSKCNNWPTNEEGKVLSTDRVNYQDSNNPWNGYYTANYIYGSNNGQQIISAINKENYSICSKEDNLGLSYYLYNMGIKLNIEDSDDNKTVSLIRINGDGSIRVATETNGIDTVYNDINISDSTKVGLMYNNNNNSDYNVKYIRPTDEEIKVKFREYQVDNENNTNETFIGYRLVLDNPNNNYFANSYKVEDNGKTKLIDGTKLNDFSSIEDTFVILGENKNTTEDNDLFYIYKSIYSGSVLEIFGLYANKEFDEQTEYLENLMKDTQTNNSNSTILNTLYNYYENDSWISKYSNTIYDTIYCNDRSTGETLSYSRNPVIPNTDKLLTKYGFGNNYAIYRGYLRYFSKRNTATFVCYQDNDKFTVNNDIGNGKLNYPIALPTIDDIAFHGITINSKTLEGTNTYTFTIEGKEYTYTENIKNNGTQGYSNFSSNWNTKDYRSSIDFNGLSGNITKDTNDIQVGSKINLKTTTKTWPSNYQSNDDTNYNYLTLGSENIVRGSNINFITETWTMTPAYGDNMIYFSSNSESSNLSLSSKNMIRNVNESGKVVPVISLNPDYFVISNSRVIDEKDYYLIQIDLRYQDINSN